MERFGRGVVRRAGGGNIKHQEQQVWEWIRKVTIRECECECFCAAKNLLGEIVHTRKAEEVPAEQWEPGTLLVVIMKQFPAAAPSLSGYFKHSRFNRGLNGIEKRGSSTSRRGRHHSDLGPRAATNGGSVFCTDKEFEIGAISNKAIENKTFKEIHMKRKFAVKSLASITKSVKINNNMVCINPNTLLHRMVCTVRSDERLEEIFQFELCAYPPSLFDESGA
ncbi:hypothetical protein J6590_011910 [Homalodisca vitripennis]|nr:hypothetical protein J6590_011910 [Homalodisca vitripennis]